MSDSFPELCAVVVDATNAREVAEFYRRLLGLVYRAGDEAPTAESPDPRGDDWLVLTDADGRARMAVQHVDDHPRPTWPEPGVAQQLHLDFVVPTVDELRRHHERAVELGATVLDDRTTSEDEAIVVLADPAGHPFCLLVSPPFTTPSTAAD